LFAAASLPASFLSAATIDGILDLGDGYTDLAVQGITPGWGAGNHLSKIATVQDGSDLAVFVAGKVSNNAILLFIDSKAGGPSTIANNQITSGGEEFTINNLGPSGTDTGMTFESGFQPDYVVRIYGNTEGTEAHVNRYDLQAGSRVYVGQCSGTTLTPPTGFVTSISTIWTDLAGLPSAANNGVEMKLSLSQMGVPSASGQTVKMMAVLVNDNSSWGSNQVLGSPADPFGDLAGDVNNIDFGTVDGTQTLSVTVDNNDNDNDGILDPDDDDDDNDGLLDVVETNTGIFVDENDTGSNPLVADTDGDGFNDLSEVTGSHGQFGGPSDPNIFNPLEVVVAGNFPAGESNDWKPEGVVSPNTYTTRTGDDLAGSQYVYQLDFHLTVPNQPIAYKYTNALDWGASGHRNWGTGGPPNSLGVSGGDLTADVGPSGIYRFSGDFKNLTHSLVRRDFSTETFGDFQAAYGIGSAGDDDDGDNLTNEQERAANTDPENADTDGDGLADDVDPEPLVRAPESRDVIFRVDMNVQIAKGLFNPGTDNVEAKVFTGVLNGATISMSDGDADGIYESAPQAVSGFAGTQFGEFKFFDTGGTPDFGYEAGSNRNFTLAADGVSQTVPDPIAFFSDDSTMPDGFAAWAGAGGFNLAPKDGRNDDADDDGFTNHQEFSFGTVPNVPNGSLLTTTPGTGTMILSWLQRDTGLTYTLLENNDLGVWNASTIVPSVAADQTGVPADYTRFEAVVPTSPDPKRFFTVEAEE
jgi:hypothetical protein